MDGPQDFLADLDRRWLGRPGYLIVELGALLALMTSAIQECTGVWTSVLRLYVEVLAVSAMALGVAVVQADRLVRDPRKRVASIFLVASLGLTVGLLVASSACGFAPSGPAALAVLAMAAGFYIECLWSSG